ncbi:MAG: hypothetical protein RTU30_12970 [Candidatus Thorarchaeota archaeon]
MVRSKSRLLFLAMTLFIGALFVLTPQPVDAQFTDEYMGDDDDLMRVLLKLDNVSVTEANVLKPIPLDMDVPMELLLMINSTHDSDLIMTGEIIFYYQGIAVLPINVVTETNSTSVPIPANTSHSINAFLDWSAMLSLGPLDLMTGLFEAEARFTYYEVGNPDDVYTLGADFYMDIIYNNPLEVITSVTGIITTAGTVGTVYAVGNGFWQLFEGIKTASKLRGIHSKLSEIRSLPNLTVIGALPALFAMLAGMTKIKKKKVPDESEVDDTPVEAGVSEYLVRQKIREIAPEAWMADKCPKCKRNWHKKTNTCKKCKIDEDEARREYAELLASKVPKTLKVLGNKKSMSVSDIAKKTKSTDYNAGVLATALVQSGVTEIQKIHTPFRSFVMNIAGLAFVIITWQQLLGDSASQWQTSLTLVGAALSFGVILALYISRKTQIQKFQVEFAPGLPMVEVPEPPSEPLEDAVEPEEPEDISEPDETPEEPPDDESFVDEPVDEVAEDDTVSDDSDPSEDSDDDTGSSSLGGI